MASHAVLVAPEGLLPALRKQQDLATARTFTDADLAAAFEVILAERPSVIAVERDFALTASGVAFLKRITAEAGRVPSEVQLIRTRRHARFPVSRNSGVIIDGGPATLIDVSASGAQVITPSPLRPNQRVRVSFTGHQARFIAVVAWSSFEIPRGVQHYRAGIEFEGDVAAVVDAFIDTDARSPGSAERD